MNGVVEGIYISSEGSAAVERVDEIQTVEGCGIAGDRYREGTGYWTGLDYVCEVTLISTEDLDHIERETGIRVKNGEHRRNIVTRGVDLEELRGQRFRIGEAVLEYDRPRPPCRHIQDLTEPGMTRALKGRGGICARVVKAGTIRTTDAIEPE